MTTLAAQEKQRSTRLPGLDLIRGGAILLVMLRHGWPSTFGGGGAVGVVAFFALSGYLITGVLLRDIQRFGRVRYGRFYLHRALRLFPALFAMLAAYFVVGTLADPLHEGGHRMDHGILTALTYTANLPGRPQALGLGHLWTLSTEEQFYFVWPILLAAGILSRHLKLVVALAAAAIIIGLVGTMAWRSHNIATIYQFPTSWAIAILIGAAARLGSATIDAHYPVDRARRFLIVGCAAAALTLMTFLPDVKGNIATYLVGGPVVALCTVVFIWELRTWTVLPSRAFRPLLALGTISYAAYLWNYPIVNWIAGYGHEPSTPDALLAILLTVLAASASWFCIEVPFQHLRRRIDNRSVARDPSVVEVETPASAIVSTR